MYYYWSRGVVTVPGGEMGDVFGGLRLKEEGNGYCGGMDDVSGGVSMREGADMNTVGNWGVVSCAGTDGRGGLDEVGVTWEGCEQDG